MKNLAIKLKRKFSQNERPAQLGSRTASSNNPAQEGDPHSLSSGHKQPHEGVPSSHQKASSSAARRGAGNNNNSDSQAQRKGGTNAMHRGGGGGGDAAEVRSASHSGGSEQPLKYTKADLLGPVPSFREVSPDRRQALLIKKLRLCSVLFDFRNESASENLGKEMKRQILLELVDHVTTNKGWFAECVLGDILAMVSANLFRALSPPPMALTAPGGYDPEEDEPTLDPTWPHLQIVYEFLLRFIVSTEPDPKLLKKHLAGEFILNLLRIFGSEDPREREYLKTILHRIYGKFMSLRSFIRRSMNDVLYRIIYDNDRHNGIGELLEILGSIINGFALPLKLEHKRFLKNVLIPLHKVQRLSCFHQQLSYCVTQFIDKDNALATPILRGLVRFWPLTSSGKEVLLLNEMEEILEITPAAQLRNSNGLIDVVFGRLARSIRNQHFQVAERALFFWNNDLIGTLTADHRKRVFPVVIRELCCIEKMHWNTTVHSLALNVTKMLSEMDAELYARCLTVANEEHETREARADQRSRKWRAIAQEANANADANAKRN